jgi:hypothetical protein
LTKSPEPDQVERLRKKLYEKAKREPAYRFYTLYDKVCWPETLAQAYHSGGAEPRPGGAAGTTAEGVSLLLTVPDQGVASCYALLFGSWAFPPAKHRMTAGVGATPTGGRVLA